MLQYGYEQDGNDDRYWKDAYEPFGKFYYLLKLSVERDTGRRRKMVGCSALRPCG